MEIKVTFRFDASESFLAAASKFYEAAKVMAGSDMLSTLPDKDRGVVKAVATRDGVTVNKKERIYPPEEEARPRETQPVEAESAATAPIQESEKKQDAAEEKPSKEQPEAPREADMNASTKKLTEQDIRDAMHRTRQRIEGEDYKDNTDSELYKKYHRQLTGEFKRIATILGAEKPSALPADKRQAFINECNNLEVLPDGTIGTQPPF